MKKRIFIGSSSEEIGTAKIVQGLLKDEFEVVIWDEKLWEKSVFRLNSNFLSDLLLATLKFDFGIIIGSPDDKVEVRGKEYMSPRDNILFELGLFVGRLGVNKCAFLVQEEVKIPSDLGGITLSNFNKNNLTEKVEEIRFMFRSSSVNELNFFPSCTLAATYYENFVKYVCEHYVKENGFNYNNKKYTVCLFRIIIPKALTDDLNMQYQRIQNNIGVDKISFGAVGRTRNIHVDITSKNGELILMDFPTVLTGITHAISNLLPEVYKSNGEEYKMVLGREVERFIEALKAILRRNRYEDFVEFHWI